MVADTVSPASHICQVQADHKNRCIILNYIHLPIIIKPLLQKLAMAIMQSPHTLTTCVTYINIS